ncbi:MAG: hypothetical protein WA005_19015 [Candidatus Binataceae bacterium]
MKASIRTAIAGLGGLALLLIATIAPAAPNDGAVAVPGAADQDPNQTLEIPQSSTQDSDQSPGVQEQSPDASADQQSQGGSPAYAGIDQYMNQEAAAEAAGGLPPMSLGAPFYSLYYPWLFYHPPVPVYVPPYPPRTWWHGPPPSRHGHFARGR